MKRVLAILVFGIFAFAAGASAVDNVVGTKHDLSSYLPVTGQVCVFCHTPHSALQVASVTVYPLWNHTLSSATYTPYTSVTFDMGPMGTTLSGVSQLCMSCHDGTVAVNSIFNKPNTSTGDETPSAITLGSYANFGTDLSNDHPVAFTFDQTKDTSGFYDTATITAKDPKYFVGNSIECSSCHKVHDNTLTPFLRTTMNDSQMCRDCHIK